MGRLREYQPFEVENSLNPTRKAPHQRPTPAPAPPVSLTCSCCRTKRQIGSLECCQMKERDSHYSKFPPFWIIDEQEGDKLQGCSSDKRQH